MTKEEIKEYFDYTDLPEWLALFAWVAIISSIAYLSTFLGGITLGFVLFLLSDHIQSVRRKINHRKKSLDKDQV